MKIAVVGGDRRMITVADLFTESGIDCKKYYLEESENNMNGLASADAIILPLPCEKGGRLNAPMSNEPPYIDDVLKHCGKETLVLGGGLPHGRENHIDYSVREELLLLNAVPTAEGALEIALRETEATLHGSDCLVIGYGRIGCYLSGLLDSLGARVTVAARKQTARVSASMQGLCTSDTAEMSSALRRADVIFNTAPFCLLDESELDLVKKSAVIIDLASLPGGVDKVAAKKKGVRFIHALALPGKVAPVTAGRIIYETVVSALRERGMSL